jgi:hypothetical protein
MNKEKLKTVYDILRKEQCPLEYIDRSKLHQLSLKEQLRMNVVYGKGYIGEFSTRVIEEMIEEEYIPEDTYLWYTEDDYVCLVVNRIVEDENFCIIPYIYIYKFTCSNFYKCAEILFITQEEVDDSGEYKRVCTTEIPDNSKEYSNIENLLKDYLVKNYVDAAQVLDVGELLKEHDEKIQYEWIKEAYHAKKPWYYNFYGMTSDAQLDALKKQIDSKTKPNFAQCKCCFGKIKS